MDTEVNDANPVETTEDTGSSPDVVEVNPIKDMEGLTSTMEYETPEVSVKEDSEDAGPSEDAEQNTSADESKDFDKHPRFQELVEQKNVYKGMADRVPDLEARIKSLENPEVADIEQKIGSKLMSMTDEDLTSMIATDPKGFMSSLAQEMLTEFKAEGSKEKTKEAHQSKQDGIAKAYQDFFKDKEDGQTMLNDGSIKSYLEEHPEHNVISAYNELSKEPNTQKAIDSAVKEATEKLKQELKAKGNAQSLSSSTGGMTLSKGTSPEMKNPDKFGGANNVLYKRMMQRAAEG